MDARTDVSSDVPRACRSTNHWKRRIDIATPHFNCGEAIPIIVLVLVLILAIGVAVKLYDRKRKREQEGFSAQAYLADVFLREFGTLPVSASVSGSLWRRRAPLVVSIRGTVPTQELREAVIRMANQARDVVVRMERNAFGTDAILAVTLAGELVNP